MQRDQFQGVLQMERMETRGSGLDVTHHIHRCKHKVQKIKCLVYHPNIYIKQTKNAGQMFLTTVCMCDSVNNSTCQHITPFIN